MEMCKGVDRVVLGCLFVATGMGAAQADANMEEEFRLIKKRLEQLEAQDGFQKCTDQHSVAEVADKASGWWDRVSISRLLEVEASTASGFEGDDESDITLSTVELGLDADINDWLTTHVLLLHEDDSSNLIGLDEGIISIGNPDRPAFYSVVSRHSEGSLHDHSHGITVIHNQ